MSKKRQCPLAMDKWLNLVVGESQIALGLTLNSRKLTVGIPRKYLNETLDLILKKWFKGSPSRKGRKRFTAIEASKMVGKLARLAEGAPWVYFLVSQFYTSIAHALA